MAPYANRASPAGIQFAPCLPGNHTSAPGPKLTIRHREITVWTRNPTPPTVLGL